MDDIPFFPTEDNDIRGGVWGSSFRGWDSEDAPVQTAQKKVDDLLYEEDGVKIPGGSTPIMPSEVPVPAASSASDSKEKDSVDASANSLSSPIRTTKSLPSTFDTSPALGPSTAPLEPPPQDSSQSLHLPEPSMVTESAPSTPTHGSSTSTAMKRRTWFGSMRRSLGGGDDIGSVFGFPGEKERISPQPTGENESSEVSTGTLPPALSLPVEDEDKDESKVGPQLDVNIQPATPLD